MASRSAVVLLLAIGFATAAATAPTTRAAMTEGAYATLVQGKAQVPPISLRWTRAPPEFSYTTINPLYPSSYTDSWTALKGHS